MKEDPSTCDFVDENMESSESGVRTVPAAY